MYRGYVKLWRKVIDAGWLKNHKLWVFWSWCLVKASHKEMDQIIGCQSVHLMPGDFIFGRKAAAKEVYMGEQSIRTLIDFLRKSQNLTTKVTNKFTIVSIVNWGLYQSEENETNQQSNQPLTNNQPTTNHKQECKTLKKKTYTDDFLKFWSVYPKKKARDKAWEAWEKRNGDRPKIEELIFLIEQQKTSEDWIKEKGQYIPYPATWLNQGRWADEVKTKKQAGLW
jgi:hypothetical protein